MNKWLDPHNAISCGYSFILQLQSQCDSITLEINYVIKKTDPWHICMHFWIVEYIIQTLKYNPWHISMQFELMNTLFKHHIFNL